MRDFNPLLRLLTVLKTALAVLAWIGGGAAVGAAGAGLFGTLCGMLDGLLHLDPGRILPIALYSTLCGAAVGAIVGGVCRVIDPEGAADMLPCSLKAKAHADDIFPKPSKFEEAVDPRVGWLGKAAIGDANTGNPIRS
jgi:hypothetical protein